MIIVLLFVVLFLTVLYLLFHKPKKSKKTSFNIENHKVLTGDNTDNLSKNINSIYIKLTDEFNKILKDLGNTPINTSGISGTLNNLELNKIVSGSGKQDIGIGEPILYEYSDLVLLNFADNLKFSGTKIIVDPIKNGNEQLITLYLVAKAKQLQCKITADAHINIAGSSISGKCFYKPVIFNDVVCNIEIQFRFTQCDQILKNNLKEIKLSKLDIDFSNMELQCFLILHILDFYPFPLDNLNIGDYLKSTLKNNLYRVKDALSPIFNEQFKNINLPFPCINLYDGCLPGINIIPKDKFTSTGLKDITWDECKNICDEFPDCKYAYSVAGNGLGSCLWSKSVKSYLPSPLGRIYNKDTKEIIKGKIPYDASWMKFEGQTSNLNNSECNRVCKNEEKCVGYTYEGPLGNKKCTLYWTADLQHFDLDFNKCERNIKSSNVFV